MPKYPRFWMLDRGVPTPCSQVEWNRFRTDASNFVVAVIYVEPGFLIRTTFVGRQDHADEPPILFVTEVDSDMGKTRRRALTLDDAAMHHTMEYQRLAWIADQNNWAAYEQLPDPIECLRR